MAKNMLTTWSAFALFASDRENSFLFNIYIAPNSLTVSWNTAFVRARILRFRNSFVKKPTYAQRSKKDSAYNMPRSELIAENLERF